MSVIYVAHARNSEGYMYQDLARVDSPYTSRAQDELSAYAQALATHIAHRYRYRYRSTLAKSQFVGF